jgi:phage repressor protein C with HTH and peptisase S24 domain
MTFQEKIDKILKTNRLEIDSIFDLEKKAGLGVGSIRKYYMQDREPGGKSLRKIKTLLGINEEWWTKSEGDIYGDLQEKGTYVGESEPEYGFKGGKIPFYDVIAVGGNSLLADQTPIKMQSEMVDPGTFLRNATGTLRVYGHSMFPKYPSGCIVAFKATSREVIIWGEDYVIELEDRRIVKRVERGEEKGIIKAVSYNVNKDQKYIYDPIDIPMTAVKRLYMVLGKIELEASM